MRTGLLAVGAAMAIVGAGVVAAVALPLAPSGSSRSDYLWQPKIIPGHATQDDVPSPAAAQAHVTFSWNSSILTEVFWFAAGPCDGGIGWCVTSAPLKEWAGNTSGKWTASGRPPSAYCIMVEDPTSAQANFSAEVVETYTDSAHRMPLVPLLLIVGGGTLLVGIGGLAIYLGVFLPGGVYSAPELGNVPDDELEPIDDRPGVRPPH